MTDKRIIMMPAATRKLKSMGEQIKLARLRRKYQKGLVAERANLSIEELDSVELGDPELPIGIYVRVLAAIGLEDDILNIAKDDVLGHFLQDAELLRQDEETVS